MNSRADGYSVRPIPTKTAYTTPAGDVIVPLWVTRHGHHLGDLDLVLTTDDPPSRLATILADPTELDHLVTHARHHPGDRVHPLNPDGARQ